MIGRQQGKGENASNVKMSPPVCLAIAGFDPSGGAGILADAGTFRAFGCWPAAAVTAVTVQDTVKVHGYLALESNLVSAQAGAVLKDLDVRAIKIGMIPSRETAMAIAELIREVRCASHNQLVQVVLDPVFLSSSGHALAGPSVERTIKEHLLPLVDVVTPNLYEAAALSGMERVHNEYTMVEAGRKIASFGCCVVVKGGHLEKEAKDLLVSKDALYWMGSDRHEGPSPRGTGCRHSSAIAAGLALGNGLEQAAEEAHVYLRNIIAGQKGPKGHGMPLLVDTSTYKHLDTKT
ncbi:MAG: bifunctional hydroxymethylpyrimidine kinase/phosphomethylpyrimidine kinase [Deltaproteobacteria bacterium]|nr:bifunctional hydroxymethylpyrimidine kinase/phosphomethylpyrimidine kinase [Deltaproteobacteria bacterium]